MRNRRQLLLATVGVLAILLIAAANLGYRIAFADLRESLDEHLGRELTGLAQSLAGAIDPEDAVLVAGDSFSPSVYLRIHELLVRFRESNELISVAVLDTLWNDPFAEMPDTLNRVVYSLLDRDGQWALMSGLTWTSPTYAWGETFYRSAAAPILDPETGSTVAIVRLEADAGYFGALATLDRLAWWIHLSSALLALALMGLFGWYVQSMRRWERHLTHSEKLIGLGRLAATIAHEIKNPLGIIKATAQRLERVEDPLKRRELTQFIPEEVERLNRILTGYLSVASPSERPRIPQSIESEISGWLRAAVPEGTHDADRFRVSVSEVGAIIADPDSPRQVFINLVRNAVDASAGTPIDVAWEKSGTGHARLTVADQGPGIPRRQRERVFEPFFTTKTKGSGLGLYAVKTLVEKDGGRVWIDDNPGGGARVIVEWPLAPSRTEG